MDVNSSLTNQSDPSDQRDENLASIEIATLSLIFILIIFGNSCVLIALAMNHCKMTRMYYFLLHLCLSDIITGLFTVLPQLLWDITYRFQGDNISCKLVKCMQIFGPYLSSYVLVMTAIDRYQAICNPLSSCSWRPKKSKLMILFAWIISIVCSSPQSIIFSYQKVPGLTNDVYDCWGTFPQPWGERIYVTWYAISVFFIPLIIITYCYVFICRAVWLNVYAKSHHQHPQKKPNHHSDNINLTDMNCKSVIESTKSVGTTRSMETTRSLETTRSIETTKSVETTKSILTKSSSCSHQNDADTSTTEAQNSVDQQCSSKISSTHANPRSHSIYRISRAKIKTVKVTVVVVICYIICSSPFICVQLWAYWYPGAQNTPIWTGSLIAILMLLSSLNSCVNPWIYLMFNPNLFKSLKDFCQCKFCKTHSQRQLINLNHKNDRSSSFRFVSENRLGDNI